MAVEGEESGGVLTCYHTQLFMLPIMLLIVKGDWILDQM